MLLSTELLSALCPYRALTAVGEITSSVVPKAAFVAIVGGMLIAASTPVGDRDHNEAGPI